MTVQIGGENTIMKKSSQEYTVIYGGCVVVMTDPSILGTNHSPRCGGDVNALGPNAAGP